MSHGNPWILLKLGGGGYTGSKTIQVLLREADWITKRRIQGTLIPIILYVQIYASMCCPKIKALAEDALSN